MGGNGLELTSMTRILTHLRKIRRNIWLCFALSARRQHLK